MGRETIYYCEVPGNFTYEFPKGVISIPYKHEYLTKIRRCISYSDRVWVQGPKGGVKIIKNRRDMTNIYGYVTKNDEMMEQFIWVKLKAQTLAYYT